LKNQVGGHKHRGRERKEKKIVVGDKPEILLVHEPHIQGRDAETKLMPPRNGCFDRFNQPHSSFKDNRANDVYLSHVSFVLKKNT
jgi:hypothetical protein